MYFVLCSELKSCRASLRQPNREESELPKTPLTRSVAKKAARLGLSIIRQVSSDVSVFLPKGSQISVVQVSDFEYNTSIKTTNCEISIPEKCDMIELLDWIS